MPFVQSVTGPIGPDEIGVALPHEHVFVDLSGPSDPRYGRVDRDEVRGACIARLTEVRRLGVDLLVDCTAIGIGRDAELLREVSRSTGIRIVCSTGIYKGFVPIELWMATPEEMAELFARELTDGIGNTGARPGVIKLATTESGATSRETDVHRAGAMAAAQTGAAIVLHSPHASVTRAVLVTLEAEGFDPVRLIWAHAHDSTVEENLELAARGVTMSLDAIGARPDAEMLDRIERLTEAGHGDRVLVSTDTSVWVNPPEMAYERSIEHLLGTFLPAVEERLGADARDRLTRGNVVRALAGTTGQTRTPEEG